MTHEKSNGNNEKHSVSTFNLATVLTISRFFLVPVFIHFFLIDNFKFAVITLVIASITDVSDGLLARRFNMGTKLGSVLDPLADKFLMTISFIVLSAHGPLPWWLALIVIGRDFYIVFGLIYLYYVQRVNLVIQPSVLSKRTTLAQFLLLTFSFITVYLGKNPNAFSENIAKIFFTTQMALIYITSFLTIITFLQYTKMGLKMLRENDKRNS